MKQEFSAGAVVFRGSKGKALYLLLYGRENKSWGFPKGHIDSGEDEREAARREVREEAGLEVDFCNGFRKELVYPAFKRRGPDLGMTVEKHAVYFLAKAAGETVKVDGDEISDFSWQELKPALKMLGFDSLRTLLRQAAVQVDFFFKHCY